MFVRLTAIAYRIDFIKNLGACLPLRAEIALKTGPELHVNKCDENRPHTSLTLASSTSHNALETVFLRALYTRRPPFSLARRILVVTHFVVVGRPQCRASPAPQILDDRGTTPSFQRPPVQSNGEAFPESARSVAYRCQIPGHQTANVLILFLSGSPLPATGGQCQTEHCGRP